ncbi:MAG: hypothetical protein JNL61_22670 [Rhizobiaceae bacterium]|nr:hypothetical protein [Rhizobiaceae bacterium]
MDASRVMGTAAVAVPTSTAGSSASGPAVEQPPNASASATSPVRAAMVHLFLARSGIGGVRCSFADKGSGTG